MQTALFDPSGIAAFDEVLPQAFCKQAIALHAQDSDVVASVDSAGGMQRKGRTLHLIEQRHAAFAKSFYEYLKPAVLAYAELVKPFGAFQRNYGPQNLVYFCAPRIERINIGEGFSWHIDADPFNLERCLAVVAYMNDVAVGGETEFAHQGVKVAPKQGRVALFPPYWSHLHQGAIPVSGTKYTIAAFMCMRAQQRPDRPVKAPTAPMAKPALDLALLLKR